MTNDPIDVLLVDDQRLMREGLRTLLELEDGIRVVGEAQNGEEGLKMIEALQPDVTLMDVRMPVMDGVEATRRIINRWPQSKVVILTTFDDDEYVFEGLRAGAVGYLLKDTSGIELADAIKTVAAGGVLIEPSVARKVVAEFARITPPTRSKSEDATEPLSDRELQVLKLLANGLTNREIARAVHLAEGTVKNYVSNILAKIGARDRTQAAIRARELNLLSDED